MSIGTLQTLDEAYEAARALDERVTRHLVPMLLRMYDIPRQRVGMATVIDEEGFKLLVKAAEDYFSRP